VSAARRGVLVVLGAMLVVCLGALLLETQTHVVRRLISDRLYDCRNHYLPCTAWPPEADVRRILEEHRDLITAIEQVHPGHVGIEVDATTCPGKADLLIWYASHQDRLAIEGLLGADSFFGTPVRLQNR
jgi:hypothetical protein